MTPLEAKTIAQASVQRGWRIERQLRRLPILDFSPDKIQRLLSAKNLHDKRSCRFLDDVRWLRQTYRRFFKYLPKRPAGVYRDSDTPTLQHEYAQRTALCKIGWLRRRLRSMNEGQRSIVDEALLGAKTLNWRFKVR